MAKETYDVGYKKPPTKTRFQKGKSGNPSGRPKGSRNRQGFYPNNSGGIVLFHQQIVQAGYRTINVIEDGKPVSMTRMDALLAQLYNKAMKGELSASKLLLQHMQKSLLELNEAAEKIERITFKIRENERREIFTPSPKPGTHGEFLRYLHEICSVRFARREIYGPDAVPKIMPNEPDNEYGWVEFNKKIRDEYLRLGDIDTDFDTTQIPVILLDPRTPL